MDFAPLTIESVTLAIFIPAFTGFLCVHMEYNSSSHLQGYGRVWHLLSEPSEASLPAAKDSSLSSLEFETSFPKQRVLLLILAFFHCIVSMESV